MKIVVISSYGPSLVNFRGHLLVSLVSLGHDVTVIAPNFDENTLDFLSKNNIGFQTIKMQPTGMKPFVDIGTYIKIKKTIKNINPQIVLSYTVKPVIYGSLAARAVGVNQVYSIITGLGSTFLGERKTLKLALCIVKRLYRAALKTNKKVFFQNPDDMNLFIRSRLVKSDQCILVNGSGVDCEKFKLQPLPNNLCFTLIARLIKDKGIYEYLKAVKIVKKSYPDVNFKLIGPLSSNPSGITKNELEEIIDDGSVEYLGKKDDVREELRKTSVFVLPSYREGTPRSVLEAMATGRPIITTDVAGCRETVVPGENGVLVPPKNVEELASAMIFFIKNPEKILVMGGKSREISISKYEVHSVNKVMLKGILNESNC